MIVAIIVLVAIAILAFLGNLLSQSPATVSFNIESPILFIQAGEYTMALWYFAIMSVVGVILLMLVFKIVWTLIRLPSIGKRYGKNRRSYQCANFLQKGMLAMGKGQWKKAEQLMTKGARVSRKSSQNNTGLFLTVAAEAAQHLGELDRRDKYLLEARQLSSEGVDTFDSALAEAELHLDANEPSLALSVLQPHHSLNYSNPKLKNLEMQAYIQLEKHEDAWRMLKGSKKQFTKSDFAHRQVEIARSLFESEKSSLQAIELVWSELPKATKDTSLVLSYITGLIHSEEKQKAETLLAREIKNTYDEQLVNAYTQLETGSSRERLAKLLQWVKAKPDSAYLNYGAAKMAFLSDELEQAKEFAEKAVQIEPLPEALALLGSIYEALGLEANALQAYKTSVNLTYVEHHPARSGDVLEAPDTKSLTDNSIASAT